MDKGARPCESTLRKEKENIKYGGKGRKTLREVPAGATVVSPAVLPEGMEKADYMRMCFAMLDSADMAAFLPDWAESPGARLEMHWCEYVGKDLIILDESEN